MGKYGEAAVLATEYYRLYRVDSPVIAWQLAAERIFTGLASRKKSCPKGAFLGLCEAGMVNGVPPGKYTGSVDNKAYALAAWHALQREPSLADDQNRLWALARGARDVKHNEQMDVVTALWRCGLLQKSGQ